jgi:hypothetical protein
MRWIRSFSKLILILLLMTAGLELALQGAHAVHLALRPPVRLPHPGAPVILCAGDSHTFGVKVPPEQSYPAQLQTLLDRHGFGFNVVNAGIPGENTSELRRMLPGLLKRYHPGVVVILCVANNEWNRTDIAWSDLEDGELRPGLRSWSIRLWYGALGSLRTVRLVTYGWNQIGYWRERQELRVDREGEKYFHRRDYYGRLDTLDHILDRGRRDLAAIVRLVESAGAQPIFMTYAGHPFSPMGGSNTELRTMAKSLGVPLVDNDAVIGSRLLRPDGTLDQAVHDRLFLTEPRETHLAGPGYAVVAQNVFEMLLKQNLIQASAGASLKQ